MNTLTWLAEVHRPDGRLYYREEHKWPNLDDQMLAWFAGKMQALRDLAQSLSDNKAKADYQNLTARLYATLDGVEYTGVPGGTFPNISYADLLKFERASADILRELFQLADGKAADKKARKQRGKP